MNDSGSGGKFLSGYTVGFLGFNRSQQDSGDVLGLSLERQAGSSDPSCAKGHVSMNMGTSPPTSRPKVGATNFMDNYVNDIMSDDDELTDGNGENSSGCKGPKGTNWQRMKWTDDVVRQLIKAVACVDDDGSLEGLEGSKRHSCHLHKKGKWKMVSKIMVSRGCSVSPQQCEDKFNDLNKRYKKLNDILGRGTSCKVVENPALMDSMPHLSAKAKETVKKLLCSKHLFYREMCAYHNGQRIPDSDGQELQICSSPIDAQCQKNGNTCIVATELSKGNNVSPVAAPCLQDNDGTRYVETEDSDESDDQGFETEDDDTVAGPGYEKANSRKRNNDIEADGNDRIQSDRLCDFHAEMDSVFKDPTKSNSERREWIRKCMLALQEERIEIQSEAVRLEKQQIKWERFCREKEMELERATLTQKKLRLENEHRALKLKHKEMELEIKFQKPEAPLQLNPSA